MSVVTLCSIPVVNKPDVDVGCISPEVEETKMPVVRESDVSVDVVKGELVRGGLEVTWVTKLILTKFDVALQFLVSLIVTE